MDVMDAEVIERPTLVKKSLPVLSKEEFNMAAGMLLGLTRVILSNPDYIPCGQVCYKHFPECSRLELQHWLADNCKKDEAGFTLMLVLYAKDLLAKMPDPLQWVQHVPVIAPADRLKALAMYEAMIHVQSLEQGLFSRNIVAVERLSVNIARQSM